MIRESLYFSFAGRKSTEFPIANVSLGNGLYDEPLTSPKSIIETTVSGNETPFFQGVKRDPLSFPLRFVFLEPWNDKMIDDIVRWLDTDYYEPLFFSSNIDRVYYAIFIDSIEQVHNGLKEGYVNLNVRCNGARSYSHEKTTPVHEINTKKTLTVENKGRTSSLPIIYIEKKGNGSVSIQNMSNGGEIFKIDNLLDGEKIMIDCESRIIETNVEDALRYDDFNDNYLELVYGKNELIIDGQCKLMMKYQYIY
ncbi:phage distal tail protein [Rossellomorea marisflavi]|uniref:phage distal tail protein n=1 Tax=Rossellomorea marisflavi TaxID=189381 RepID=UPI003F9ED8FA